MKSVGFERSEKHRATQPTLIKLFFGSNSIPVELFVWNSKHPRLVQRPVQELGDLLTERLWVPHQGVVIYKENFYVGLANEPGFHDR